MERRATNQVLIDEAIASITKTINKIPVHNHRVDPDREELLVKKGVLTSNLCPTCTHFQIYRDASPVYGKSSTIYYFECFRDHSPSAVISQASFGETPICPDHTPFDSEK